MISFLFLLNLLNWGPWDPFGSSATGSPRPMCPQAPMGPMQILRKTNISIETHSKTFGKSIYLGSWIRVRQFLGSLIIMTILTLFCPLLPSAVPLRSLACCLLPPLLLPLSSVPFRRSVAFPWSFPLLSPLPFSLVLCVSFFLFENI